MKKLWFKNKSFGYGWQPCSVEGWLVTVAFVIIVIFLVNEYAETDPGKLIQYVVTAIAVMILIAYKTGEPLKWQWGNKKEKK